MSKMVHTVTGPIPVEQMGRVLPHEHIAFAYPGYQGDSRFWDDRDSDLAIAVAEAKKIVAAGIDTLVDATPNDCGRDPLFLKAVSEASGLQIVCTSGYYLESAGAPNYFKNFGNYGHDMGNEMYDLFTKEVTTGIGSTGIRSGALKISSSKNQITDYEMTLAHAVGQVAAEQGLPVLSHTQDATMGVEQADLLLQHGVAPEKIMIGHSCDSTDMDYLLRLADKGVFIGFDRWGLQGYWGAPTDRVRLAIFLGLIRSGYTKQLMASHDATICYFGKKPGKLDPLLDNWNCTYFTRTLVPYLKEHGVTDEEINTIMVENPRRFFGN